MKADNFTSYLQEPSLLHDISYQELKSMVVQYPYCQNLRYLLVTKSHMDDKNEYQTDLHLAATYSIDRNFLFKHLHQEAYTQTSTESLVLEKEPELDIPTEAIPIIVAAPIAKEVLNIDRVTERRTIRIQSENAKLYAEQKAGLTDESAPSANFIDKIAEVEERISTNSSEKHLEDLIEEDIPNENPITEEPIDRSKSLVDIEEVNEDETGESSIEAEPVTDRSKLITYIEKPGPKKSRSVIDQLMKRNVILHDESTEEAMDEDDFDLEDEMESIPNPSAEMGETPPSINYDQPKVNEVIFEITNEMENTEDETDYFLDDLNSDQEENGDGDGDEAPTEDASENQEEEHPEPIPKSSFKDWKEKFLPDPSEDPPTEVSIEEILRTEEDNMIEHVIEEEIAEEKKKKGKKKKKSKNKKSKKEEPKKKDKKKKKKRKIIDIAKKSIENSDDIISETLAELLAKQGSRKKAIQMYERLSLIFPEKSAFFAAKIEKLKK